MACRSSESAKSIAGSVRWRACGGRSTTSGRAGAGMSERSVGMPWTGRFFVDFAVGDVYEHPLGRTVLPVDNSWFTLLTQNTAPLHFDAHYAAQTEWGRP